MTPRVLKVSFSTNVILYRVGGKVGSEVTKRNHKVPRKYLYRGE